VRQCDSCQRAKAFRQRSYGELHPLQMAERRWQSISMDLITDLPVTESGKVAIIVFVARLSNMVHVDAITKTCGSKEIAHTYENWILRLHGVPQSIISDRDPRFASEHWQELHQRWGTQLCMSTARHAQTDGQTERVNGVLEDTLRHFVGPCQNNWDCLLPVVEFAMNNSFHEPVRNTPFMLNYGQHPDTPAVTAFRTRHPEVNKFVGRWSEQLAKAKQCLQAAQQRQKQWADKHRQ
jgi:hypothetical protein